MSEGTVTTGVLGSLLAEGTSGMPDARPANEVIDQAIKENAPSANSLYLLVVFIVVAGLFGLVWGIVKCDNLVAIIGAIATNLLWPALRAMGRTRKENTMLRMLEFPLSRAETCDKAADMLQKLFKDLYGDERGHP